MAVFEDLPNEILLQITSYCDACSNRQLSLVSSRLSKVCPDRIGHVGEQSPTSLRRLCRTLIKNPILRRSLLSIKFTRPGQEEEDDERVLHRIKLSQETGGPTWPGAGIVKNSSDLGFSYRSSLGEDAKADLEILVPEMERLKMKAEHIALLKRNRYSAYIMLLLHLAPNLNEINFHSLPRSTASWEELSSFFYEFQPFRNDETEPFKPLPIGLKSLEKVHVDQGDTYSRDVAHSGGYVHISALTRFMGLPNIKHLSGRIVGCEDDEDPIIVHRSTLETLTLEHSDITGQAACDIFQYTPNLKQFTYVTAENHISYALNIISSWAEAISYLKGSLEMLQFSSDHGEYFDDYEEDETLDSFAGFEKLRSIGMPFHSLCGKTEEPVHQLVDMLSQSIEELDMSYAGTEFVNVQIEQIIEVILRKREGEFPSLRKVAIGPMSWEEVGNPKIEAFKDVCEQNGVDCSLPAPAINVWVQDGPEKLILDRDACQAVVSSSLRDGIAFIAEVGGSKIQTVL